MTPTARIGKRPSSRYACAVDRCLQARQQIAAYALIVDAKDATAKAFYEHFGLRTPRDAELTLYLPLRS